MNYLLQLPAPLAGQSTTTTIIAVLVALGLGGLLLALLNRFYTVRDRKSENTSTVIVRSMDDRAKVTDDLWIEVRELRRELDEVKVSLETSRKSYYDLLVAHTRLQGEHDTLRKDHDLVLGELTTLKATAAAAAVVALAVVKDGGNGN